MFLYFLLKILFIVVFIIMPFFIEFAKKNQESDEQTSKNPEELLSNIESVNTNILIPPKLEIDTNLLKDITTVNKNCTHGLGVWVGENNMELTNCEIICNSPFSFYQFYNESDIIVNSTHNKRGGYCRVNITTDAKKRNSIKCNRSTSMAVLSDNVWICQPKIPQFGGEHGTEILICNGILIDRLENKIYVNFIPKSLDIKIDEKLQRDGFSRYVCGNIVNLSENELTNKAITSATIERIENAIKFKINDAKQPFEYVNNYCLKYFNRKTIETFPNANEILHTIRPNFETGECNCGQVGLDHLYLDPKKPCIPTKYGVNRNTDTSDNYKKFAFKMFRPCLLADHTNSFINNTIDSYSVLETPLLYPCGIDSFTTTNNGSKLETGIILPSLKHSPYVSAILDA